MQTKPFFILFLTVLISVLGVFPEDVSGQRVRLNRPHELRIAFYNVENLFDIYDEPGKNDINFTPEGRNQWTQERYDKKIKDLGKVLNAMGGTLPLALIGLCEVENKAVINDLALEVFGRERNYGIVHRHSADTRGIDVALIYNKTFFDLLNEKFIEVRPSAFPDMMTRDIVYVKGVLSKTDTLHVFLNHWPSRIGGLAETEPRRIAVAEILRSYIDEVLSKNPDANIIVMGDFNDEPNNKSVKETLNAKSVSTAHTSGILYNLMFDYTGNKEIGTYKFRGSWNVLDHIIVSKNLLNGHNTLFIPEKKAQIFKEEWLFEPDERFSGRRIFRTYWGANYAGGYSDHLPVYIDLEVRPVRGRR